MSAADVTQTLLYLALLLALAGPSAWLLVRALDGRRLPTSFLERPVWKLTRIDPAREMSWVEYTVALLVFNLVGFLAVYALLYAAFGVQSPFLPALLDDRGLHPDEIGLVMAASTAIRVLAGPAAAHAADRWRRHGMGLCAYATAAAIAASCRSPCART